MAANHVYLVVVHMYDTSEDEYYVCDTKAQALIFAANLVIKDLMDGARCRKKDMLVHRFPTDRLNEWADDGCCHEYSNSMEWSSGSIGSVRITKTKMFRNNKLK